MSSTFESRVDDLKVWLDRNAYWREDLVVSPSKYGGIGVFLQSDAPDEAPEFGDDPLLLRIPKSNLLSAKNSFIYNLQVDYDFENVDLASGMFSLILTVIYELSLKDKSPWFDYLNSIDFDSSSVPICLWSDADKQNLKNTEVDLLNLLNDDELMQFYNESIRFAHTNSKLCDVPSLLEDGSSSDPAKVLKFGQVIQSVISRAFKIDNYYDLAMVPGADLFNHKKPQLKDGKVVGMENIHFVCDGSVCEECGENECDHDDSDIQSDTEEIEDDEENMQETGEDGEVQEIEEDADGAFEEEKDSDSSDSEEDEEEEEGEEEEMIEQEEEIEPLTEITMDYIEKMEAELENDGEISDSDAETEEDPGEQSTVSMSDGEEVAGEIDGTKDDLAKELSDSSKCCDVILVKPTSAEDGHEVFNSYGNELSNAYLLQKYGFITDDNVNDSILLSVEIFKYVKKVKGSLTKEKQKQIDLKLQWYESMGFDIVNQLVAERESASCCDDEGCEDNDCGSGGCENEVEDPESWPLSARIKYNSECTLQTYSVLNLVDLDYRIFKMDILSAKKERKLIKKITEHLLEDKSKRKIHNGLIKDWCLLRLSQYPNIQPSPKSRIIQQLIDQEKAILQRYLKANA